MNWKTYPINPCFSMLSFHSLFVAEKESSYRFPGETHDFWECVVVLRGSICASDNECVYHLATGDMILHRPMALHKFHVTDPGGARLLIFSFSATESLLHFFTQYAFHMTHEQIGITDRILRYMQAHLPENVPNDPWQHMEALLTQPDVCDRLSVFVRELLLCCSRSGSDTLIAVNPETQVFGQAVKTMQSQPREWLTIEEIARHCHISATQLKRIFTKYSSLSVHKYYLKLKLAVAAQLLRDGLPVSEIAEQLGFSSANYFSTVYRRETGMSPTSYREL